MSNNELRWSIAIHGGAGAISTADTVFLKEAEEGLEKALSKGSQVLSSGGSALEAVEAAVSALEDDPSFNAGQGSVLTLNGRHELEASIMYSDGLTPVASCGACCLITRIRNPIKLARLIMEKTPHVMLAGPEAEHLADKHGLQSVDSPTFFTTARRRAEWEREIANRADETKTVRMTKVSEGGGSPLLAAQHQGLQDSETVGAVAIDSAGRLAAATSTGGRTCKLDGRIGDSPIIGSGTYASSEVAVSGTGWGEQFMKHVAAYDVAARMKYKSAAGAVTLQQAVHEVVNGVLGPGDGGIIAVDREYNISSQFNTEGMFRGEADHLEKFQVSIFKR
ncbi:hypothetical protein CEUSTIGMA_g11708.t1 [Chlamydomonas eustigma]|uniref:beta-aspartyl-peptidase n=1 Tax=Chlamydomonas eustigma TaxID=1157962 RepID=A0A250XMP2_9CHLO|nr:hypothetical protein CEUSTIGMA_g11708.t1 [Chlamydomonas eustigma]|eukprot:GAX84286.1 hypothetical protein CEUSTIGMA_g11708.t1 [Chlamydomonas eustigma]